MSGEATVHLAGSAMVPLVRAAAHLAETELGRFAVIGGVAVTARLGRAHRATTDVDTVVDDDAPPDTGRTSGWLRSGGAEMASVQADDLIAAGTDLSSRMHLFAPAEDRTINPA